MKNKIMAFFLVLGILLSSCTYSMTGDSANQTSSSNLDQLTPTPTATPTPQARVAIAEEAMQNGDYDTALAQFQAALSAEDPEIAAEALLGIGRIYYLRQDYTNAVQQLGWLINSAPSGDSRTKAFYFLAKSYQSLDAYDKAADAFQNFLAASPTPLEGDILEMQGDNLISAGETAKAREIYQKALAVSRPEFQEDIQLKIAQSTASLGENDAALALLQEIYDQSTNQNTKAAVNLYMGRIYLSQGKSEEAYARFQDSVMNYVSSYDTYSVLIALVEAGQPVDDLHRGIIDYFAGQYGLAVNALDRYMDADPQHDDAPHYYKALSLYNLGDYEGEVAEWDKLIQDHPDGAHFAQAFLEKATTQKAQLSQYSEAAQTLLSFVTASPTDADNAAYYIFRAARIYEESNQLNRAAQTWERIINEYPGYEDAILAQFEAGICYYRLGQYSTAQVIFQKNSILASSPTDKARAALWIAKSLEKQDQQDEARSYYQQAANADPTGYYSIRASQILNGQSPFPSSQNLDLGVNWPKERKDADDWMREKFNLSPDIDLSSQGDLAQNILYQRGDAFWELGLTSNAFSEFESLRQDLINDPVGSYRLMNHMLDLGVYYSAISSARQVLDLTGLDQTAFIDQAPAYFNHIRYGIYYRDLVVSAAKENDLDPLILFSVIRQESAFEADIASSWGAIGLMQIVPGTGTEIFNDLGWPPGYSDKDLSRPIVSVKFGSYYLTKWYPDDMVAAIASYNAGVGSTINWKELSGDDNDLFVEVIRASETRDYVRLITEYYEIYKKVYTHA